MRPTSLITLLACVLTVSAWQTVYGQPIEFEHANLSFYVDKEGARQRILNRDHWEIRRQQVLMGMQEAMGKFPSPRDKKFEVMELSSSSLNESVLVKTILISVTSKSHVVADVYLPQNASGKDQESKKLPAVLALHPTGAQGKKIIGGSQPKTNRQYANELAQRGYVVIAPDYPSFGDLKNHNFADDGFPSGTMQGILNHMRCVDYLETLDIVDDSRIGVIGHSLGGHNAIFVAAFDPRLKAIVTSCGWTPFHDYYGGKIEGWTSTRYMPRLKSKYQLDPNKVPFDFYELLASLAPRPFYTNSPLHDSNFDVAGVKKAIPKIQKIYSLFASEENVHAVYPKCGHDFPTEIRDESYRFLDRALQHKPKGTVEFKGELPRIKPLEPLAALDSFDNPKIQLAASEPLVHDPIAMSFDEHQRLFVIEMKGYSEQENEFRGRVRMLQDKNADGLFETSTVFAEGLSWPTAVICYGGGVFVAAAPDIWFLKDTDGDGKADVKKKVFTGFGRSNVQGLVNCFRWGMDNRIHGAASSSAGKVYRVGKDPKTAINLRGADFSFDPRTLDIRRETGGAQHGMSFDDFGNKFVCSNSDHAQAILFDDRYLSRNPYAKYVRARKSIAVDGGQAPVFRSSPVEPWRVVRTRLRVAGRVPGPVEGGGTAAGYFTGSTGITIYRGDADSVEPGTAIIGDVGSNIVHRKKIIRNGLDVKAVRIDEKSELVTSTDIWFRPVQFGHGPDGCLYILDMYREVIEHPKSLPPMIKQHLDLTEGRDRGRIYRLGKPRLNRKQELKPELSGIDLVPYLNHPNSWHRETAARLIYERQDRTCIPVLQKVRVNNFGPVGNIHALWALKGLGELKFDDLVYAVRDSHPEVRRHAILLAETTNPDWLNHASFAKLENDPDIRVRCQLAFSLGEIPADQRRKTLWRLLRRSPAHPLMTTAIMSSVNGLQVDFLTKLSETGSSMDPSIKKQYMLRLTNQVARRNLDQETGKLSALVLKLVEAQADDSAFALLFAMEESNPSLTTKVMSQNLVSQWFSQKRDAAWKAIQDSTASIDRRILLMNRIALDRDLALLDKLLDLVSIEQPVPLQIAAIRTIGRISPTKDSSNVAKSLIAKRSRVGSQASAEILKQLLGKTSWTKILLRDAKVSDFPAGQLDLLTRSNDNEVRTMAKKLLASSSTRNDLEIMKTYQPSLKLLGDSSKGKTVFEKNCSRCHRAGGIGFEIGPNLATMKSRGRESLLTNILAPNREVNPAFTNYLIQTMDGRSFSGMIDNETETTITLKKEKQQVIEIAKSDIESIKNTGLSLMPTGLEKEISVEQMADLLEFLMQSK